MQRRTPEGITAVHAIEDDDAFLRAMQETLGLDLH